MEKILRRQFFHRIRPAVINFYKTDTHLQSDVNYGRNPFYNRYNETSITAVHGFGQFRFPDRKKRPDNESDSLS